jgi:DNA-binding MarR family transcriptional regulator/GNAT superfamily N-acetyltransferase
MTPTIDPGRVASLRGFNRFYTGRIGALHEGLLRTEFSLTESRLLWELAHRAPVTAAELARELELDPGYMSRLLAGLRRRGLIKSARSKDDARQSLLSLSAAGRRAFAPLDERSQQEVSALLAPLGEAQQQRLLASMANIEQLLAAKPAEHTPFTLRTHRAGDLGWIVSRHGTLYEQEWGLDMRFEALVARISANFIERFDDARERCWIAERQGERAGCVMLVQARDEATGEPLPGVAQLRLLLVEPAARGLGLGAHLTDECSRFAREAGYRRIQLWTNSVLLGARHIYAQAGYRLLSSEPHHSFGQPQVGETWALDL